MSPEYYFNLETRSVSAFPKTVEGINFGKQKVSILLHSSACKQQMFTVLSSNSISEC